MSEIQSRYTYYKSIGICPACGKRQARPGKVHCAKCATKRNTYYRTHKENKNKANRTYLKHKTEKGLCVKCGKPTNNNGIYCEDCAYVRNVKRKIIAYRKKQGTWTGKLFDEVTLNKISLGVLHKLGVL